MTQIDPAPDKTGLEPAGPHTARLWADAADMNAEIARLDFIQGLGEGTLEQATFDYYLAQDAAYLRQYSRALARASQLATTRQAQAFWAQSANDAIVAEMALHDGFLDADGVIDADDTTLAYTNHLLAVAGVGSYAEVAAAVLPCFWVYLDVGLRLHAQRGANHPYGAWLDTYADQSFADGTVQAIAAVEDAMAAASEHEYAAATKAFHYAVKMERDFFNRG